MTYAEELFGSKSKSILDTICNELALEENLEILFRALFGSGDDDFVKFIISISEKYEYFDMDISLLEERMNKLYSNPESQKSLMHSVLCRILKKPQNKMQNINLTNVQEIVLKNYFWEYLGIAAKKCLSQSKHGDIFDEATFYCAIGNCCEKVLMAYSSCRRGFNKHCDGFSLGKLPLLNMLLHKNHSYSRPRTQKKQLTRITKQAKKIIVCYKAMHKNGGYFSQGRHDVPEGFIGIIKRTYLK